MYGNIIGEVCGPFGVWCQSLLIAAGNVGTFKSYHIGVAAAFVGIGEMVGESEHMMCCARKAADI